MDHNILKNRKIEFLWSAKNVTTWLNEEPWENSKLSMASSRMYRCAVVEFLNFKMWSNNRKKNTMLMKQSRGDPR